MSTFRSLASLTILFSTVLPSPAKNHLLEPTGIMAQAKGNEFLVQGIDPGSPAEGKLKKGDTIIGAAGKPFSKMPVRNLPGQSIRPRPPKALFPSHSKADEKSRCNSNPWAPTARPLHGIVRKPMPSSLASQIRCWSRNMLDLEICRLSV